MADSDARGARCFTLQVKARPRPRSWRRKHSVGAARWWVNEKPGWDQEPSSVISLATKHFSLEPHLHCFFNSSRFPLPSSAPFSHRFPTGLPALFEQPAETNSRLRCWRRSCARRVTECSRDQGFSHAHCAVTGSKPARERRALRERGAGSASPPVSPGQRSAEKRESAN